MRKLTKVIKRRRKNYKPTIGLILEDGSRVSVNAEVYYIFKRKQAEAEAHRQAKQFFKDFLEKAMPDLFGLLNLFDNYMYY